MARSNMAIILPKFLNTDRGLKNQVVRDVYLSAIYIYKCSIPGFPHVVSYSTVAFSAGKD